MMTGGRTMSRHQPTTKSSSSEESGAPPPAERLRALCAAADQRAEPSESLRRRVGELARRHEAAAASWSARWPARWSASGPALGAAVAVVLLVVVGLSFFPVGRHHTPVPPVRIAESLTVSRGVPGIAP